MRVECIVVREAEGRPIKLDCEGDVFVSRELLVEDVQEEHQFCDSVDQIPPGTAKWFQMLALAMTCVLCAALAAGMTLGFTSLDPFQMQVLANSLPEDVETTEPELRTIQTTKLLQDQQDAEQILPVITGHLFGAKNKHGWSRWVSKHLNPTNEHYLLVTLLLCNAAANEALPLFLDRLVPEWAAVLLSVTVVLIFGEIIPSAIFTGPSQLRLAAGMVPLVRVVKLALIPIVWPISLLLDTFLGHQEEERSRSELRGIVRTLRTQVLDPDEANIIQGVLDMHRKSAKEIASPLSKAKMLPHDLLIDARCIEDLLHWGHSRIFVYRRDPAQPSCRDDIMGVLLVKKLVGISPHEGARVGQLATALKEPIVLHTDDNLLSVLNKFQAGQCHLAVISEHPDELLKALQEKASIPAHARPSLFCSLEDVIEAMLKEDIFDEEDIELGRHTGSSQIFTSTLLRRSWTSQSMRVQSTSRTRRNGSERSSCSGTSDAEDRLAAAESAESE